MTQTSSMDIWPQILDILMEVTQRHRLLIRGNGSKHAIVEIVMGKVYNAKIFFFIPI